MPASQAVIDNMSTRKDLNYPTAAEVNAALKKAKGDVRNTVDLLRKSAKGQPPRSAPVATGDEDVEAALSPPPLPRVRSKKEPEPEPELEPEPKAARTPAPAPKAMLEPTPTAAQPSPSLEPEPDPDPPPQVEIDDSNPRKDKAQVFAEPPYPIYVTNTQSPPQLAPQAQV